MRIAARGRPRGRGGQRRSPLGCSPPEPPGLPGGGCRGSAGPALMQLRAAASPPRAEAGPQEGAVRRETAEENLRAAAGKKRRGRAGRAARKPTAIGDGRKGGGDVKRPHF